MLNCFYWYSIIWVLVFLLYNLGFSSFNKDLNGGLVFFIACTSALAFLVGRLNRSKFKYSDFAIDYGTKPIVVIVILYVVNFVYAGDVPLFSILNKTQRYGDFEGMPLLYVVTSAVAFYYGINYFNAYLNSKKKRDLISFLVIIMLFLLVFSRSSILFLCFGAFILYLSSRKKHGTKERIVRMKSIMIAFFFGFITIYAFGALGNVRSGYKFDDNSYIERIGLYEEFPSFIPKQFMWAYSYLTTPLANLNNNVKKENSGTNFSGVISELIPRTISKRLFPDLKYGVDAVMEVGIEKEYFNAVTGYFIMYSYGGFIGMFLQFCVLLLVTYLQIKLTKLEVNKGRENTTYIILILSNMLMFFYNSLNTTMVSWWLIINFFVLLKRPIRNSISKVINAHRRLNDD